MHIIPELYYSFFTEDREQIKYKKIGQCCALLIILDVDGIPNSREVIIGVPSTTPGLYQGSRSRDEFIMGRGACIFDLRRMLTTPGIQQDPLEGFVLILRNKSHQRGMLGQKIISCFGIWKCLDQQESFSHITSIHKAVILAVKLTQRNRLSLYENYVIVRASFCCSKLIF